VHGVRIPIVLLHEYSEILHTQQIFDDKVIATVRCIRDKCDGNFVVARVCDSGCRDWWSRTNRRLQIAQYHTPQEGPILNSTEAHISAQEPSTSTFSLETFTVAADIACWGNEKARFYRICWPVAVFLTALSLPSWHGQ